MLDKEFPQRSSPNTPSSGSIDNSCCGLHGILLYYIWNPFLLSRVAELILETGKIVRIGFKVLTPQIYPTLMGIEPGLSR